MLDIAGSRPFGEFRRVLTRNLAEPAALVLREERRVGMPLKWISALVATGCVTAFITANAVGGSVPVPVNLALAAGGAASSVLAVAAELYQRLDARLDELSDFLAARLDEVESRTGDYNAGFVEGFLSRPETPVTPLPARTGRRREPWPQGPAGQAP